MSSSFIDQVDILSVGAVPIQQKKHGSLFRCSTENHKSLKPFKEQLGSNPARITTCAPSTSLWIYHQLWIIPFSRKDKHRWHVVSSSTEAYFDRYRLSSFCWNYGPNLFPSSFSDYNLSLGQQKPPSHHSYRSGVSWCSSYTLPRKLKNFSTATLLKPDALAAEVFSGFLIESSGCRFRKPFIHSLPASFFSALNVEYF